MFPGVLSAGMESSLPDIEYRLLCQAINEAGQFLAADDFAAGYKCLLAGVEHARELAGAGEAWAKDLEEAYRTALFQYSLLYPTGPKLETERPVFRSTVPRRRRKRAKAA